MDNYYGYAYPQQNTTGYTQYACAPYASAQLMPSPASHNTLDKQLRGANKKINKSISGVQEFIEEFGSHSTDESIHLVRSRRANAANASSDRYHSDASQMMKKRSQSGTSIMKGMASQLSVPRSQSDDRSVSPSFVNEKRKHRKEKRASKKSGSFHSNYDDQEQFTYSTENRLIDAGYFIDQVPQQQYVQQQQQQFFQPHMQYGGASQYQQQYQQQYYQPQQQYSAAPGAPCDYYNQSSTQNFQASNPSLSYYQQADVYGSGTQTSFQQQPQQSVDNVCTQNLPNGAKIVAEYFLGYLDEQQQYQQCQQQQQSIYQQPQMLQQAPLQYPMQYQGYEQPQQQQVQCPPGCQPAQMVCPPGCVPEMEYSSDSEANKEEVEVEIWEKTVPKKEKKSRKSNKSCDDFKKLTDIIETLEKKLGDMSTNGTTEPIQPIFLMPKQAEQSKPIYVPRNIYVPVIRPVFVPRERVIVRPQIIHVARPVLVDRPVPIQQRPLVIERDRPVPVRVETIETNCAGEEAAQFEETTQEAGEPCVDRPGVTETTYHEFAQDSHHFETGSIGASALAGEEANANKQLVMDLIEEAERRKSSMQSKSNEMLNTSTSANNNNYQGGSSILDSVPYSAGYTLEVLDQRVSDKFERVDEETIKSRYGVESFQYMPENNSNMQRSSVGGSYKSLASNGNAAEYAPDSVQASGSNGNLSSILTDLAMITGSKQN